MKREIQVEITNQCHLNCIHCSSKNLRALPPHDKLFSQQLIQFLTKMGGNNHVYLTGGDPLCLKSLPELCNSLSAIKDLELGLFTNGIVTDNSSFKSISIEYAHDLCNMGIKDCYISLYGPNAPMHNCITNADTFDLTCASIKNLASSGIETNAHIVLSKISISKLIDTIQLAERLGMKSARILHLVKTGNAVDNWDSIGLHAYEQENKILEILNAYTPNSFKVTISGYPHISPCRPIEDAIGCQRGINLLYITYDGAIYPCACTKSNENFRIGFIQDIDHAITELQKYNKVNYFDECANTNRFHSNKPI